MCGTSIYFGVRRLGLASCNRGTYEAGKGRGRPHVAAYSSRLRQHEHDRKGVDVEDRREVRDRVCVKYRLRAR